MYLYDEFDRTLVAERVTEFRDQVGRRISGELTEEEFKPLRLMNGVYLQLHAYMLRIAIPYGTLSSRQLRMLAHVGRRYDRNYGHFTTRQNIQFNWIKLESLPDAMADLASAGLHGMQTSGNCVRNITTDQWSGVAPDEIEDPRIWAELLRQHTTMHPEFTFLPRKFKIAVTAATHDRAAVKVHDIGLHLHRNGPAATTSTSRASKSWSTISAPKPSRARSRPSGSTSRTARSRSIRPWSPRSRRAFAIRTMRTLTTIRRSSHDFARLTAASMLGSAMRSPTTKCRVMPS